ncbi:MAG: hypothetical protein KAY22_24425 [Rhizorhabdus sp.]|uniref:hypothetical protein n=1 Tax=Rhizorhabdus sp. TaxID=1968843 RepID=UPI001B779037|nr:hypothetical protein [Rhizorhabdus sp.]MBP8235447.1 hypothetical protein [Rhizorhabdus sp.]
MAIKVYHHSLNIGVYDVDKLHRVDLERMRLAAEIQENLLCDAVGKAFPRPGSQYVATCDNGTTRVEPIPFVAGTEDAFILEMSDLTVRVLDCDTDTMVTRNSVSDTVGAFSTWTLASTSGQTTSSSGDKLTMSARGKGATASGVVSVAAGSLGTERALRIVVERGPVRFRLGSTSGGVDLLPNTQEQVLRTGYHSIAFTPDATPYYIQFLNDDPVDRIVASCAIEAAGVMELPTPWPSTVLKSLRFDQSLDVMYLTAGGAYAPKRIERRGDASWSIVNEVSDDGPFYASRSADLTLTPAALTGNTTLTASRAFFKSTHVGALFRLVHEGQKVNQYLAGANQFTDPIMISGITETNFEERKFTTVISGTWVGTLKHFRSFDGEFGNYLEYRREQASATINITGNATFVNDDNDDNADVWVKVGFDNAGYTSGEANVALTYQGGGGYGICRVVSYTSETEVNVEVLRPFKGTHATKQWREGRYSALNGYPAAVMLNDGRLMWSGSDQFDASISDAYSSFDETFEGDAGPISRSIALGGRNEAVWMLGLSSPMIGCDSRVANARASSLDEKITPANFSMKSAGKIGAANLRPVELADDRGLFVASGGRMLYEIVWAADKGRYVVSPFTKLTSRLFRNGVEAMAVQTLPDQRIWITTTDGDMVCIVFEPTQQILAAHIPISTGSDTDFFEGVAVVPGDEQDRVYVTVKRVVNGTTIRTLEKLALDREVEIDDVCKIMDSHVTGTGAHSATISVPHLEGRTVVAWVDGEPVVDADGDTIEYVVTSGSITVPDAPTLGYCVGLPYDFRYKSARLAYGAQGATPMLSNMSVSAVGLMLQDYIRSGVKYGIVRGNGTFSATWDLPGISSATQDTAVESNPGSDSMDEYPLSTDSPIDLDCRVCVAGASPKPFTLTSLVLAIERYGN